MKCRFCNHDAIYTDGLCRACHEKYHLHDAKIMSQEERDGFCGQTINEDGSVHEEKGRTSYEKTATGPGIHLYSRGLSWRAELALGFILFCVAAVIIGILGLIVQGIPFLAALLALYILYTILKAVVRHWRS